MTNLLNILENCKGCKFVGITYVSDARLKKTGNPFAKDSVTKITRINCQFNYDYETAVKNRIAKNDGEKDNFVGEKLPYGVWVTPNKIIKHNENIFVRFYRIKNAKSQVRYFINGDEASAEQTEIIKQFLPTISESKKQNEAGLTAPDQVQPFNINIENILTITIDNVIYKL